MDGFNMGFEHGVPVVKCQVETVHGTKVAMLLEMQKYGNTSKIFKVLRTSCIL